MLSLFTALSLAEEKHSYSCLVDAGGKMELLIYRINENDPNDFPKKLTLTEKRKVSEDLSTAYYDGRVVPESFEKIISWANFELDKIAETDKTLNKSEITFYVGGTSRMRALDVEDQENIRKQILDFFAEKKAPFIINNDTVAVISSVEEAIYTFISLNKVLGKIKNPVPVAGLSAGGSYIVSTKKSSKSKQNNEIRLGGNSVTIGIGDFPAFSTNNLKSNHTKQLARMSGRADVESACYPTGYISDSDSIISVKGTADFNKCDEQLEKYSMKKDKYQKEFFFDKQDQPPLPSGQPVYAIGAYYYVWENIFEIFKDKLQLTDDDLKFQEMKLSRFAEIGEQYCKIPQDEMFDVIDKYCKRTEVSCTPERQNDLNGYAVNNCFDFAIQRRLLSDGYLIPDDKVIRIKEHKIESGEVVPIDWQIGFIMTNEIINEYEDGKSMIATIIIATVVSAIVIVVIVIISVKCIHKKHEDDKKDEEKIAYVDPSAFENLDVE